MVDFEKPCRGNVLGKEVFRVREDGGCSFLENFRSEKGMHIDTKEVGTHYASDLQRGLISSGIYVMGMFAKP